ncbi:MAG: phosphonate ABC transporter, permease protein PhnE [Ignavibacteria bacterium]|nr:phosphonate ABC transporter, permease protein PhnE [Ignavibacteria bacterium]
MRNTFTIVQRVTAIAIDIALGAYLFSVLWFVLYPALIENPSAQLPNIYGYVLTMLFACAFATAGALGASLGRLFVTGKASNGMRRTIQIHLGWILLLVTIVSGWIVTDISPSEFFSSEGLRGAGRIFSALITPQFDIISAALSAMVETVYIALMSTIIAVPASFILAFPAARNLMQGSVAARAVYSVLRAFLNIVRSMEPIIWAIIFSVWVGIGPFAGMLALVVHTVASLTKLYSEQIEDVKEGPIEAISATGASQLQVMWFAIVPQCVIPFLSFTIYRWDINVRMATIIGFVGGGGIGTLLTQYQGLSKFHEVGTLVIVITLVVWILDVISARIRAALQ